MRSFDFEDFWKCAAPVFFTIPIMWIVILAITQDIIATTMITIAGVAPFIITIIFLISIHTLGVTYEVVKASALRLENIKKINEAVKVLENHLEKSRFEVVDYRKPAPLKGTCPTSSSQDFRITVRSGQIILEN